MNERDAYEYHRTRPLGEQFRLALADAWTPPARGVLIAFAVGFGFACLCLAR